MIDYRQSDINYHNFFLDTKPREWFKRQKEETIGQWLKRTAYQSEGFHKREHTDDSIKIAVSVLSFLRENKLEKEEFEDLVGFEVDLHGQFDYTISQIRKIETIINRKLV
jgi:hypothetical protein